MRSLPTQPFYSSMVLRSLRTFSTQPSYGSTIFKDTSSPILKQPSVAEMWGSPWYGERAHEIYLMQIPPGLSARDYFGESHCREMPAPSPSLDTHPHQMAHGDRKANRQCWGAHVAIPPVIRGCEDASSQLEGENHLHHDCLARGCVVVEL